MDRAIAGLHPHSRHHVLMAAVITLLSACDAAPLESVSVPTGIYTARAINGSKLPYQVPNSTHSISIASASARVYANGRYQIALDGVKDGVAGPILRDNGSYTLTGSTIVFSSEVFGVAYTASASVEDYAVAIPGILVGSTSALRLELSRETKVQPPVKHEVRAYGERPRIANASVS
jgi:hypothetical protein